MSEALLRDRSTDSRLIEYGAIAPGSMLPVCYAAASRGAAARRIEQGLFPCDLRLKASRVPPSGVKRRPVCHADTCRARRKSTADRVDLDHSDLPTVRGQ